MAAARRRLAEREIVATLAEVAVDPIEDPIEAFAQLCAQAVALKDFLAGRLAQLEETRYTSTWNTEQQRAEMGQYERAFDRAGRLLAQWVSLGLDDRRLQLSEARGRQLDSFLRAVLTDLGLIDDPRLPLIIRRHAEAMGRTGAPAQPLQHSPAPIPAVPVASRPAPAAAVAPDVELDDELACFRFDDDEEDR